MKPFSFCETRAHENDPLPLHLEHVADGAANSVSSATSEIRIIAFVAGLFHDIGKATPFFQVDRLKKQRRTKLTTHAKCGAVLAWWFTGLIDFPLWMRLAVFVSILRHHGDLGFDSWKQPWANVTYDLAHERELPKQLESLDLVGIRGWLQEVARKNDFLRVRAGFTLPEISMEEIKKSLRSVRSKEVRTAFSGTGQVLSFLAGFGGLLAADKIHAAIGNEIKRQKFPCDVVDEYKKQRFRQRKLSVYLVP